MYSLAMASSGTGRSLRPRPSPRAPQTPRWTSGRHVPTRPRPPPRDPITVVAAAPALRVVMGSRPRPRARRRPASAGFPAHAAASRARLAGSSGPVSQATTPLLGRGRRRGRGLFDHGGFAAAVPEVLRPVALVRRAGAHVDPRGEDVSVVAARVDPGEVGVAEAAGPGDVLGRSLPLVAG